jgi:hypothetical protein
MMGRYCCELLARMPKEAGWPLALGPVLSLISAVVLKVSNDTISGAK